MAPASGSGPDLAVLGSLLGSDDGPLPLLGIAFRLASPRLAAPVLHKARLRTGLIRVLPECPALSARCDMADVG